MYLRLEVRSQKVLRNTGKVLKVILIHFLVESMFVLSGGLYVNNWSFEGVWFILFDGNFSPRECTVWISRRKNLFSHNDVNNIISEHVFVSCRVEESTSRWIRRTKGSGD